MRPIRVYFKIFLSFLGVLVVVEAFIFILFMALVGRSFRDRYEQDTAVRLVMLKDLIGEIIEDRIRLEPGADLGRNESLSRLIRRFGETFGAKVWLSSAEGEVLVRSFEGSPPVGPDKNKALGRSVEFGGFKLYRMPRPNSGLYTAIPVDLPGPASGQLHVLFKKVAPPHPSGGFALGLVLIGGVVALLVIPVSRLVTRPLKELTRSALRIADGDLSHRASIRSGDEIGELGRAFNRMAERLEGMIRGGRELTANVSHQLRSPLARIRVAEELLREKLGGEGHEQLGAYLKDIQEDVEEMDERIGRILALSKLDLHDMSFRPEPLDPSSMVQELLSRFGPSMDLKALRVEINQDFAAPFFADKEAMITVFTNLFENAAKYTPEKGKVVLSMTSRQGGLHFSIMNTSMPLSAEQIAKIFDPFYRVEGTPSKGTGLGLAITRKLIEKQGGTIAASQSEEGLRIEFSLPPTEEGIKAT